MFLSKHKNGFYYVYYIDPISNKRKSISTKTKLRSEANNFLSEFSNEFKERKKQKTIPIKLKDFIFQFLKYSESVHSENTTKTHQSTFKFFYNSFGNVEISSIINKDLLNYFEYRIRISSIYRARIDRINLGSAFNRVVADKYLLNNPCDGIKSFRVPEKQPLFFSQTEYQKLLSVIDNKDLKDLVEFALNTRLRQMELLTLKWS
jgi:integrase